MSNKFLLGKVGLVLAVFFEGQLSTSDFGLGDHCFVEVPVSPILFYAWLDLLGCHQFYHYHLCLLASLSVPWSTTNSKVPDLSKLSCPWVVGPPFRWSLVLLGVSVVQSARHVVSPKGLGRIRVLVLSIFPDLMIGIRRIRRRCWSDTEVLRARD